MTQTFPGWLSAQQDRTDDTGALAREVAQLDDFPDSGGKAIFDGYFETTVDADCARYERAWTEFEASPEPSASDSLSERPDGF